MTPDRRCRSAEWLRTPLRARPRTPGAPGGLARGSRRAGSGRGALRVSRERRSCTGPSTGVEPAVGPSHRRHGHRVGTGAPLLQERPERARPVGAFLEERDRKSTRLNSSHTVISYAVFCLKKKKQTKKYTKRDNKEYNELD